MATWPNTYKKNLFDELAERLGRRIPSLSFWRILKEMPRGRRKRTPYEVLSFRYNEDGEIDTTFQKMADYYNISKPRASQLVYEAIDAIVNSNKFNRRI